MTVPLEKFYFGPTAILFALQKQTYSMPINITIYNHSLKERWDTFVKASKNGTFLFMRDYMDYHSDRFTDYSLLFYHNNKLLAILPANIRKEEQLLVSHGGLTYGGFIIHPDTKAGEIIEIVDELKKHLQQAGIKKLIYKPVPYIYNRVPSEEPLYALFHAGATISARSISTTIDNSERLKFSQLRKRCIAKAKKAEIACEKSDNYEKFWDILTNILQTRHNSGPVHTLEEIKLLHSLFPENIKLYTANYHGEPIAGIVVYETELTAHFQYIATSDEGCSIGALDMLVSHLIENVYANKRYIDFGTSTEQGGKYLNNGLITQKEGFGGRAVVYDTYELNI